MLGFKEITVFLGIGLGIAFILLNKKWRKIGVISILLSVIWGLLAFKFILPYFSGGRYLYATEFPKGIFEIAGALVNEKVKRETLFYSLSSFSFLPILSPQFWLVIIQDYATRFIPLHFGTRWTLGLHYNAQSAVLLSVSSVFALKFVLEKFKYLKKYSFVIALLITINGIFLFRFVLHGPFLLAANPVFYQHTKSFSFMNELLTKIPENASIMTHNNLAPRFTHQEVQLLTVNYPIVKPDYILIDRRAGQSPNNFLGSDKIDYIFEMLKNDKNYSVYFKTEEQFIFNKVD